MPLRRQTEKYGALTIPDYFEARFGDKTRSLRVLSMFIIIFFYTLYVAAQFVGAVLAAVLLGWLLRPAVEAAAAEASTLPQSADAVTELKQN